MEQPFRDPFVFVNLDTSSVFFALSAKLIVCLIYTYFLWTDMQMKLDLTSLDSKAVRYSIFLPFPDTLKIGTCPSKIHMGARHH